MNALERHHYRLDRSVGPFFSRQRARGVQSGKAHGAARAGDDMATSAGAQNFMDVVLHGHVARDGGNIARHDIGSADVRERMAHGYLHQTFLRRAQEEPSYESDPEAVDPISVQRYQNAQDDH